VRLAGPTVLLMVVCLCTSVPAQFCAVRSFPQTLPPSVAWPLFAVYFHVYYLFFLRLAQIVFLGYQPGWSVGWVGCSSSVLI
jgi:hypothetical protein